MSTELDNNSIIALSNCSTLLLFIKDHLFAKSNLKAHLCRFENLSAYSNSCQNNILKVSHS